MMDICTISKIHLFKGPAVVLASSTLVWVSSQPPGYYLFLHRQKCLLEILECVASELPHDLLNFVMVIVFSDPLLLIFPTYCHPVTQIHFGTLTYVVYKLCLVLWLLSVAGCWVRTSASRDHLFTASSAPPVKECAHTDWAAGLVLSHPLSLQRVFPIAKVVLQHWRLPSEVTGERRGREIGGRAASSHFLSLKHTQEGESVPLGNPGLCWPWLGPWCTPHLVAPSPSPVSVLGALSIQLPPWHCLLTVHFLSIVSCLWNIPSSSTARILVPSTLGFLIHTPVCPVLTPCRDRPEGKVWLTSRGNQISTRSLSILHINPCLPPITPLCHVGKAALMAGILCD